MSAPLLVIAGETASGKTAVAIAIARALSGELIGADSVQVYRGFDIGSAKPTAEELGDVTHHLIDVRDADEPLDAMQYAALADAAIADVQRRGKLPIVVGGTGLWLRALLRGLVALPPVDAALRAELEREADEHGAPALHARLAAIDPRAARAIHANDRLRIVRALEVHRQTGRPLGDMRAEHALGDPRHDAHVVVLERPRAELELRIATRVGAMIAAGLEGEVRRLRTRYGDEVRAFGAVGYREMLDYVRRIDAGAEVSASATEQAIVRATRIYARRQRTWFKSEPGISERVLADEMLVEDRIAELAKRLSRLTRDEPTVRYSR